MIEGSCLCGDIQFQVHADFTSMSHCHCAMCRKVHGSMFATYIGAPAGSVTFTAGEDRVQTYESSPGFIRAFCPRCGSVMPETAPDGGYAYLPAGNLEGDPGIRPQSHIFVASKAPWFEITDTLPRHDEYAPGDGATVERADRSGASDKAVGGSCLCGAVSFEYSGTPTVMWNCHCTRCRKARGAAHATNVFVRTEEFRWRKGDDNVAQFKLPEAKRFGQAFCKTCGSAAPRAIAGAPVVAIPAGCLDDDPGARPAGHIYVGSRAPWYEPPQGVTQYEEGRPSS